MQGRTVDLLRFVWDATLVAIEQAEWSLLLLQVQLRVDMTPVTKKWRAWINKQHELCMW